MVNTIVTPYQDDKGIVIMMVEEKLPKDTCQGMMQGSPGPLNSQFKLSYFTLLNVLRRQGSTANMEYVISNSFQQFQWEQQVPGLQDRLGAVQHEVRCTTVDMVLGRCWGRRWTVVMFSMVCLLTACGLIVRCPFTAARHGVGGHCQCGAVRGTAGGYRTARGCAVARHAAAR